MSAHQRGGRDPDPIEACPTGRLADAGSRSGAGGRAEPVRIWRRLLDGWMAIVARFGFVQTLVILSGFYAAVLGPVAMVAALGRRDLLDKRRVTGGQTAWQDADSAAPDLERAKLTS